MKPTHDQYVRAIMAALEEVEPNDIRRLAEDEPTFVPLCDILLHMIGEPSEWESQ